MVRIGSTRPLKRVSFVFLLVVGILAAIALGPGIATADDDGPSTRGPAAVTQFFRANETLNSGASKTLAFGRTIKVTSIMIGDLGAALKLVLGGPQQSVALEAAVPGQAAPFFLWEGSRTAQLDFSAPVPMSSITARCIFTPGNNCDFMLTVVGF